MADYCGFRFGNVHTKDLNLVVVSSNNRYEKNLLPENNDYNANITGGDGQYYFGQTYNSKEISCEVAFDSVDEKTWRKISALFSDDRLQDLVFDELPYKTYKAKLKNKPEFKFICFTDKRTGDRVYKGEGSLNFICYYPFAFGFNKYIVKAADYYKNTPPSTIIKTHSKHENPYANNILEANNKATENHFNIDGNMGEKWSGGYPSIEQVQAGELFYNEDGQKKIINTRAYWDNIPEWAPSSQLLTTPTLDYDQELIYTPQYSKVNYINMDIGMTDKNAMIGSRILVYNPGDMPIDFDLKLVNNHRLRETGWIIRNKIDTFQIRRYNVQRLTIEEAVDWTGLKTYNIDDNETYKYGNKYFKMIVSTSGGDTINLDDADISDFVSELDLTNNHPNHCYITEPIPKEKLGHYIRTFYWQTSYNLEENERFDYYNQGVEAANEYERLYELCILEEEKEELYWKTLKEVILKQYNDNKVFDSELTLEDFIYDYIHKPLDYIKGNELPYGQIIFNINKMPEFFTDDYIEIKVDKEDDLDNKDFYIDSSKQMLYTINGYDKNKHNDSINYFDYKPEKQILNDNIVKGHWFKIPKGWSLIEIVPVYDKEILSGKTWLDARDFSFGYGGENANKKPIQKIFDKVYDAAAHTYLLSLGKIKSDATQQEIDKALGFRFWFTSDTTNNQFGKEYLDSKVQELEIGFLKMIQTYWSALAGRIIDGYTIQGNINEWWWYACNYAWQNFPPPYWGAAELLNKAEIKYIPLFY